MPAVLAPPAVPVGKIKSFGPVGPAYKVGELVRQLDDGDWIIQITMIESAEQVEYRLSHMRDDPEAR